jgi:hypothetical protein
MAVNPLTQPIPQDLLEQHLAEMRKHCERVSKWLEKSQQEGNIILGMGVPPHLIDPEYVTPPIIVQGPT